MKYVVILCDGMADRPIDELGNKTPLEYAYTPNMGALAKKAEIGLVHTIPEGMAPGSDTANLSVLGYDPKVYYTGRSPLEALSIGVPMKDTDIALRCNIVTLTKEDKPFEELTIVDHSSSEISTEDCAILLDAVKKELQNETYQFYVGTSYRHLTIWDKGSVISLTPPHDVLGQMIGKYLPKDEVLKDMMKRSYEILKNHPLNIEREKKGLNPANCCWFWGAGTRPELMPFTEKTGLKGVMISAVDLLKGIGVGAKMKNIIVPGANGTLHTNYKGKAEAAMDALLKDGYDFAYIHIEAPDEMGHQGSYERKIKAIENIDKDVVSTVMDRLKASNEEFRVVITPDHPTPIEVRTHTNDPVPYLFYDSTKDFDRPWDYTEKEAKASGNYLATGPMLTDKLFGGRKEC